MLYRKNLYGVVYLDDAVKAFRLVNRLWNNVADSRIVRDVVFRRGRYCTKKGRVDLAGILQRGSGAGGQVHSAAILHAPGTEALRKLAACTLASFPNLRTLDLQDDYGNIFLIVKAFEWTGTLRLRAIEHLRVDLSEGISWPQVKPSSWLQMVQIVKHLDIRIYVVNDEDLNRMQLGDAHILEFVGVGNWSKEVDRLSLDLRCTDIDLEELSEILDQFPKLNALDIVLRGGLFVQDLVAQMPDKLERMSLSASACQIMDALVDFADRSVLPNLTSVPTLTRLSNRAFRSRCSCETCSSDLGIEWHVVEEAIRGLQARKRITDLDAGCQRLRQLANEEDDVDEIQRQ